MLSWASTMLAFNARPPDPAVVGERWRELWLERLEQTPPFVEAWLSHQRRDEFWKQGSVCEDYGAIRCPVYMVGGWADGYSNAILRFLAGYEGPRKGLIGPWGHLYPHDGLPGPAIGFLQEALRWWDHWLKGTETGIMEEPMLRAWMHDPVPPRPSYAERPGRWVAEPAWPPPSLATRRLELTPGGLEREPGDPVELAFRGSDAHGLESGTWVAWGSAVDFAPDQRGEDGRSLCFTSAPLDERLELLGLPGGGAHARLRPAVRAGGGAALRRGAGRRVDAGHDRRPQPHPPREPRAPDTPRPGKPRRGDVAPEGDRVRLPAGAPHPPRALPHLLAVGLAVARARHPHRLAREARPRSCSRSGRRARRTACSLPSRSAEGPPPLEVEVAEPGHATRTVRYDVATGRWELATDLVYFGSVRIVGDGLELRERGRDTFAIVEGDPLSAEARSDWSISVGRGDWRTRVETTSRMTADAEAFRVTNALDAYEGEARIFAKTWHFSVPRDLV